MSQYHKINSLFKRDEKGKLILGQYSQVEFEYLHKNIWVFDEKVDGTNIRLIWDGDSGRVKIGGKTDNAQIPSTLYLRLQELIEGKSFFDIFSNKFAVIYGEGYGLKIQKAGSNYNSISVDFVAFDIFINNVWLKREDVLDISEKLGFKVVPIVGEGTLDDLVAKVSAGFKSNWGDFLAEGIVARPKVEILSRMKNRIITKLKARDF